MDSTHSMDGARHSSVPPLFPCGSSRLLIILVACELLFAGCSRQPEVAADPATREAVWLAIQPLARRYRIEPEFIYALVAAESNFDSMARNGEARGLMQLKPAAWRQVSRAPYEPAVWDWRRNLEAGVDYLAWCRSYLHRKGKYSPVLLLAAFHYGIDQVEKESFKVGRLGIPDNAIYRELWRGNPSPVPPPQLQLKNRDQPD